MPLLVFQSPSAQVTEPIMHTVFHMWHSNEGLKFLVRGRFILMADLSDTKNAERWMLGPETR